MLLLIQNHLLISLDRLDTYSLIIFSAVFLPFTHREWSAVAEVTTDFIWSVQSELSSVQLELGTCGGG